MHARTLSGDELAREVARVRLGVTRSDRSHGSLADALTIGTTAGLNVSEMCRVAGCSRQTAYNLLREHTRPLPPPGTQIALESLLVLVAAGGAVPVAELVERLRLERAPVLRALLGMAQQHLCVLEHADAGDRAVVWSTPGADDVLREHLDDLLMAQPDSVSVYLQVDKGDVAEIERAANTIVSSHEHVLLRASVAPSVMTGPELALAVRAPTVRRAMATAASLWDEIRDAAGMEPAPARFASVIPPAAPPYGASLVLDAFVDALSEVVPTAEPDADLARARYSGGVDERQLAGHCLTAAARALRIAVGQEREPRPIDNGEAAFFELETVMPMRLDRSRDAIKGALVEALARAVERIGPFPGGRLAPFRSAEGPNLAQGVRPTPEDLEYIARHAGLAVGHAATLGKIDASTEVLRVVTGH